MPDDNGFSKWSAQIDLAILRHASSATPPARQDLRQEILLALVELGADLFELDKLDENRARGLAYTVAKNAVISYSTPVAEKISRRSISLDSPEIANGFYKLEIRGPKNYVSPRARFFRKFIDLTSTNPPDIDMDRAIALLTDDQQTVIRGLFFEGRSQEQVAADLDKTRHWVRLQKESALAELKRLLRN